MKCYKNHIEMYRIWFWFRLIWAACHSHALWLDNATTTKKKRRRRPPPISLSILYEKNKEYIQKHTKNMQIHINICKNVEKYIKKNSYAAAAALPRIYMYVQRPLWGFHHGTLRLHQAISRFHQGTQVLPSHLWVPLGHFKAPPGRWGGILGELVGGASGRTNPRNKARNRCRAGLGETRKLR